MTRCARRWFGLAVGLALSTGCGETPPASPTSFPSPTAAPNVSTTFEVSGIVTSEGGGPIQGAAVTINYDDVRGGPPGFARKQARAVTDVSGRYAMTITASALDSGFAYLAGSDFESDVQLLARLPHDATQNFTLNRRQSLAIGGSVAVAFRKDDNRCGGDLAMYYELMCRYVYIEAPADGTLTVTALGQRPGIGGADLVVPDYKVWPSGVGTVSFAVKRGEVSTVALRLSVGSEAAYIVTAEMK